MSAVVKLSSKLPGDAEINGLDAFADHLLEPEHEMLCAIVLIDAKGAVENFDEGTRVPVARVRRIEPLGVLADVPEAVKKAMAAAEQARTGRKAIPFGVVEVGEHAFGDALPEDED